MLRLADRNGVPRDEFLKQYMGNELDPNWVRRVGRLSGEQRKLRRAACKEPRWRRIEPNRK